MGDREITLNGAENEQLAEGTSEASLNILLGVCVFYLSFLNLFYIFSLFVFSRASIEIAVS